MLKKKNIAMAMAVATVATSVAPVFAAVQNVDEATMISKVKELIDVKYFGKEDKVYEIRINSNSGIDPIKDIKELERAIANAKIDNAKVTVYIKDKGHVVVNGRIEANEMTKYTRYTNTTIVEDVTAIKAITNVFKSVVFYNADGNVCEQGEAVKAVVELTSGKVLELVEGENKLDTAKAVDANGNTVDLTNLTIESGKKVTGFKVLEGKLEEKKVPEKNLDSLVFNAKEEVKVEKTLSDFYGINGLTKDGVVLVDTLHGANEGLKTVISNGKDYTLKFDKDEFTSSSKITVNKDGKYELSIDLKVAEGKFTDNDKFAAKAKEIKLVLSSVSHSDLTKLQKEIKESDGSAEEGKEKFSTLAGANRFATAIKVSEKAYNKHDDKTDANKNAGSVVLVGQDAIVDGLAAAPLAKQNNAPILLTKKDAIDEKTMAEIKRVLPKNSTIFLVGGEGVISKDVEAQLIKEMNAKIVRLAGDNRYETSVKVAENMMKVENAKINQAFVVGGTGEADAMSIAAVASKYTASLIGSGDKTVSPIIVARESKLDQDAKDFLYANRVEITNVDVVGGTSKVSRQVIKDIEANVQANDTVTRVAGDNRQETNAMVINKFYSKDDDKFDTVFVAKDGAHGKDFELIDALAAAPLAGREAAPIVLATDKVSDDQVKAIKANLVTVDADDADSTHAMTKVGHGILDTVIEKIMNLLTIK